MATTSQPTGNHNLVDYGIHTEQSDLRAHVCVTAGRVYVYPTKSGVLAIESEKYRKVSAYQPGVKFATAEGYPVPAFDIDGCIPINARWAMKQAGPIRYDMSTSDKGAWAVNVVALLLRRGWFPMFAHPDLVEDFDMQINGVDVLISGKFRIQVKCDYEGGEPKRPGAKGERVTGNLFLQVAECNPFRRN